MVSHECDCDKKCCLRFQIEKLEDGQPGRYRVTGKMNNGEEFVDEFNTVSLQLHITIKKKFLSVTFLQEVVAWFSPSMKMRLYCR